ncbi:tagatose 1,6-diphosphate aldolase [Liquorilactobacillus mali]|uniref:Tagatose 1,6-diphosphate aldolase n=1 Tax=Liquorilactobacillus mali KCTC 3596 = DSM 20444 TaxID=1046596 RepID=J1F142_9LACO|nr:tagatose 1,6-diphosphate aldolase [Liquorilactobacillus mali]EJE97953.1 tagatose 1,6-diphosphate aldolase [Liquorilactobacillus mali KCTC 3596 = DSM 20444]KRN09815.1 tagatose 1,6-diphosphate aldolase [Liquorilactobacillus mali KCTC 3596 = DSM 20444]MDC7953736.1 tagatose 1,6-diphosphate aldolase [Liquorilactobacillus mali]QFQ75703.1 tagatose 1,6-diphosphate aldolase [Liquorilactobacillus mali]
MNETKKNYLRELVNEDGIIAALAIDQRGSLKKMIATAANKESNETDIVEFKKLISSELTTYASAILLDPEYGLPAAKLRASNSGLLTAYEKTGYDTTAPGRMPDLLADWSALRLKEAGADAIKFMLYYDVDEDREINHKKQAFVERIGAESANVGLPFFLELMSYDANIEDTRSKEYAQVKPHKVIEMVREFAKERYQVDVLKIEVPVNMDYVEGYANSSDIIYSTDEALSFFKEQDKATSNVPFIFLSAGVSAELFQRTLKFASKAGSTFNGVLCGRATWRGAIEPFAKEGKKAGEKWLRNEGRHNIEELNEILKKNAMPLFNKVKL